MPPTSGPMKAETPQSAETAAMTRGISAREKSSRDGDEGERGEPAAAESLCQPADEHHPHCRRERAHRAAGQIDERGDVIAGAARSAWR